MANQIFFFWVARAKFYSYIVLCLASHSVVLCTVPVTTAYADMKKAVTCAVT